MRQVARDKFILLTVFIYLMPMAGYARCADLTAEQLFDMYPIFVRGLVREANSLSGNAEVKVEVENVLKGVVADSILTIRYANSSGIKPRRRVFEVNKVYIIPIKNIRKGIAEISPSSCGPELTETEVLKLKMVSEKKSQIKSKGRVDLGKNKKQ